MLGFTGSLWDVGSPTYFLPSDCEKRVTWDLDGPRLKSYLCHWVVLTYLNLHFSSVSGDKNLSYRVLVKIKWDDVCMVPNTMHTLHIVGIWYTFVFFFNPPTGFWGYLLFFYPVPHWVCDVNSFSHLRFIAFLPESNTVSMLEERNYSTWYAESLWRSSLC